MTYSDALLIAQNKKKELDILVAADASISLIITARGRYIAALQAQKRAALKEGKALGSIEDDLNWQLNIHKNLLKQADKGNRKGQYSMVKEWSLGMKSLINSVRGLKHARNDEERVQARKDLMNSIGKNLKNTLKAPVVVVSKILSTSLVAKVIFAPVSIGMGILHAAWTALDDKPAPYDNSGVVKMSNGFEKIAKGINRKVQSI